MISLDVDRWDAEAESLRDVRLSLIIPRKKAELLPPKGERLTVTVNRYRRRRSLNANAYLWKLCDEIARAVQSTKEDVYRRGIRACGVFESIAIRKEAAERFRTAWEQKGVGWVAEMAGQDMTRAYINAYYGSSTYDTEEMARVIDWAVNEAEGLGIDTLTPNERSLMLEEWKNETLSEDAHGGGLP